MPTPLKRWNGIKRNHVSQIRCICANTNENNTFFGLCVNSKIQQKCCARDATMQLSTCNMVTTRVPQENRRNETSMQLVGG